MDKKTAIVLKKKFKEYYYDHVEQIEVPPHIDEREFGYMTFDRIMMRHLSFQNSGDMQAQILKASPASVYYSTSFYEGPSRQMHEKGWKGGDLVFDIDADTLSSPCRQIHDKWICRICGMQKVGIKPNKCPGCKGTRIHEVNIACDICLDAAKNEALKLQDILINDFGIQKTEIDIFFSGSMGYHLSIANSDFTEANQAVRSDIVDYVSGQAFISESLGVSRKSTYENMIDRFPSEKEKGWRGRIARYFKAQKNGEGSKDAPVILIELYRNVGYRKFRLAIEDAAKKSGATVDPSVTTDIHRILRLPGTLHGKTGLLKKRCKDLESFSPMEDAVAFGHDPMKVLVDNSPKFSLFGEQFGPFKSESIELPTMAAIYLLGQDMATVEE
tara:strand:+ start:648 stop:1805 length:1158 start_codon:yes stop_codon:yes gene_type:complete